MYQNVNGLNRLNNITSVNRSEDKSIKIKRKNGGKSQISGSLVSIENAEKVTIENYYGNELTKIVDQSDIFSMSPDELELYCNEARVISNRIVLTLNGGKELEISGKIQSATDN